MFDCSRTAHLDLPFLISASTLSLQLRCTGSFPPIQLVEYLPRYYIIIGNLVLAVQLRDFFGIVVVSLLLLCFVPDAVVAAERFEPTSVLAELFVYFLLYLYSMLNWNLWDVGSQTN